MAQPLEIVAGTTNAFTLALTNADGVPYQLQAGEVLVFALARDRMGEDRALIKPITKYVNGEYYMELAPADTADLLPMKYYYDVGLQTAAGFYNVIPASPFTLLPGITQAGDGA